MTVHAPLFAVMGIGLALAFAWFMLRESSRTRKNALAYSQLAFLEGALGKQRRYDVLLAVLWSVAIAALGIALARPSLALTVASNDVSVVLCIDTSGSMRSLDVAPTRAEAARAAARAFVDGVPDGTRLGIVAFSSTAILLGPLGDRDAARDALDRVPPPNGGTAIGDALLAAARLLPKSGRRAIVLVTDGVNNVGSDPQADATEIGASGIGISTVGIGTSGSGELVPGSSEAAEIDEDALRAIAQAGHGSYGRVADAAALRNRLAALAGAAVKERKRVDVSLPLAVGAGALALLAVAGALAAGRFP